MLRGIVGYTPWLGDWKRCTLCGYQTKENVFSCPKCHDSWKEQKQKKEEPIILTDEQITEMWESGYISDKEEYKDGND